MNTWLPEIKGSMATTGANNKDLTLPSINSSKVMCSSKTCAKN